jgi:hypothetical protein
MPAFEGRISAADIPVLIRYLKGEFLEAPSEGEAATAAVAPAAQPADGTPTK